MNERLLETIYDITWNYAWWTRKHSDPWESDSRGRYAYLSELAERFEREHTTSDWGGYDADYMETVDVFSFEEFNRMRRERS